MNDRWAAWDLEKVRLEAENLKALFPSLGNRYIEGEGNCTDPSVFIVCGTPGAQEEIEGRPLVGQARVVLRQLLRLAGIRPIWDCWTTNLLKYRPPGNRPPAYEEMKAFRPLLQKEWGAVARPKLIIPLGGIALMAVMGKTTKMHRVAGTVLSPKPGMFVAPMLHPDAGIRNERLQPDMETHWENLGEWREDHDA
jgi:uracil-DNA glycosylase family 4